MWLQISFIFLTVLFKEQKLNFEKVQVFTFFFFIVVLFIFYLTNLKLFKITKAFAHFLL